jgi:putative copper export protein
MLKKTLIVLNGFIHDFAAGIWLATIVSIVWLHGAHLAEPTTVAVLNSLERRMFWASVVAAVIIMATGAGRTFTYVDNWYGKDAERQRRKALIVKHIVLFSAYALGYFWVWNKVFH